MDDAGLLEVAIAGVLASHRVLDQEVVRLTEADCRAPSSLPGWSRGHLLTHLARNADSVLRRLEGAARDEIADQYAGGVEGRAAEIEAGAARAYLELAEDVRASSARVDAILTSLPEDAWPRLTRGLGGKESPAALMPYQRWREVECHLVDLDIGYSPSRWPSGLVDRWLPEVTKHLHKRTDPHALLAWGLNRGDAPELGAWG